MYTIPSALATMQVTPKTPPRTPSRRVKRLPLSSSSTGSEATVVVDEVGEAVVVDEVDEVEGGVLPVVLLVVEAVGFKTPVVMNPLSTLNEDGKDRDARAVVCNQSQDY